jgi:cbb3-type cytochrome oxidase subunit 3
MDRGIEMNKIRIALIILLFFSLIFNGLQFHIYSKEKNERITVEKSLLMNDFSVRAEKWRNFNQFLFQILDEDDINYPITKQQSDIYYELAKHETSVILKQTNFVGAYAISPNYSDYAQFIIEFDQVFETLIQRFNSKLPLLNREQLVELSNELEKGYKLYLIDTVGEFGTSSNGSIIFEPDVKMFDKVIAALSSIRKNLETVE